MLVGKPRETQKTRKSMFSVNSGPKCGATDGFWAQGPSQLKLPWECKNRDYYGAFIMENGNLATILQVEWKKGLRTEGIARSTKVGF